MFLVTGTSMLVPVVGLATAPILTHALGVAGRGEAGAAMAPNLLIVGGATLGLPAALTYLLARHPHLSRIALAWASLFALVLGAATMIGVLMARRYLSGGDGDLAYLMALGTFLALPALLVGLLRGAATGRQMWRAVAIEKALTTILRLVALAGLAIAGRLDVTSAVLVMCGAPVISGLAYVGLALRPPPLDADLPPGPTRVAPNLIRFGSQVWLGSVATMLMARMSQLLVTPLSNVTQLGLLIVAITVSDVPYIVTQTVREVTFGVNSAESDSERLLATSRIATLVAAGGSLMLGATLPLWIELVFGSGFGGAVVPTWLLLVCSCVTVPGLIAGAGVDSAGRPGLRSAGLLIGLGVSVVGLLLLVPPLGAVGAALSALLASLASSLFVVAAAAKALGVSGLGFVLTRRSDVTLLTLTLRSVIARIRPARAARVVEDPEVSQPAGRQT